MAEMTELLKEAKGLLELSKKEERSLSEEGKNKFDQIEAKIEELNVQIKEQERLDAIDRQILDDVASGRRSLDPSSSQDAVQSPKLFSTFGEQLQAVRNAYTSQMNRVDQRLLDIQAATGMSESVPSDGGFLVQTDFTTEILRKIHQNGILSSRTRRIPISGNSKRRDTRLSLSRSVLE